MVAQAKSSLKANHLKRFDVIFIKKPLLKSILEAIDEERGEHHDIPDNLKSLSKQ